MAGDPRWDVVSTYTRKQAIEDGELVDVTPMAQAAGFKLPTVFSSTLFADFDNSQAVTELLRRFYLRIVAGGLMEDSLVTLTDCKGDDAFMQAGPGDDGQAVLTVMRREDL